MMVADRFVPLDYTSNGRAMLGVGPGALVSDATMMGIDPVTQRPRMDEALGVIVRLLNGEVVMHRSDWMTLNEAQLQLLPVNGDVREGREYERQNYYRRVAGMKNNTTLKQQIEEDTSLVDTPDDMIAALERLLAATGGFGGFLVLANDWANQRATLDSYELIAPLRHPPLLGHARAGSAGG